MTILDTHLHLVYPDRFTYPNAEAEAELRPPSSIELYLSQARRLGISRMIHMEVCVADHQVEAETAFITGLHEPAIIGAVSSCRPELSDFPAFLDRAAANPAILGFRRVLHTESAAMTRMPLFRENIARLAGRYTFDLCALPHQLGDMADLATACPDVTFVLDHCGIPPVSTGEAGPWRQGILDLARCGNVMCKISGVIAYGGPEQATAQAIRPYVEHCIGAFGWKRVVWGSDWPICTRTADLARWVEATHALLNGCSASEISGLLHRNAERIYRPRPG